MSSISCVNETSSSESSIVVPPTTVEPTLIVEESPNDISIPAETPLDSMIETAIETPLPIPVKTAISPIVRIHQWIFGINIKPLNVQVVADLETGTLSEDYNGKQEYHQSLSSVSQWISSFFSRLFYRVCIPKTSSISA